LGYPEAELSLLLLDDPAIARMNKEYLGHEGSTNVISFAQDNEGESGDDNEINLLGDVVMSVDTAICEAEELGYTLEEMLDFYLIHGILHLIGFDHVGEVEEAARMTEKSEEIWALLGY
jgi:probable rRNA maturation factor